MVHRGFSVLLAVLPSALCAQSLVRRVDAVADGTVRLTYAAPDDVLEEGLDRIRRAVEEL